MKIVRGRNVCQLLPQTIRHLLEHGRQENSRAGAVLVSPEPMIIVTEKPQERVLFSPVRDANPFFHIAEAIWMLGGRDEAKFLDRFIHDFSSRYAEEDGLLHDAYGYRWRYSFGFDQLEAVVKKLMINPFDRQAVIQMWDASTQENDLLGTWKSRPCNTNIFVRINDGKLDLTTCCRSNDMLWGAHGANAVHFSVLQEYLAAMLEIPIGTMYQLSNNAHVYIEKMPKINDILDLVDDRYFHHVLPQQMFIDPEYAYEDIDRFMQNLVADNLDDDDYANPWFYETLSKMLQAHALFKQKKFDLALNRALEIQAGDWQIASYEWIERRVK